jgi:polar amino acid transport system substrate-binding protein
VGNRSEIEGEIEDSHVINCAQSFVVVSYDIDVNYWKTRYIEGNLSLRISLMTAAEQMAKCRQRWVMFHLSWLFVFAWSIPVLAAPVVTPTCQLRFALDTPFPPHIVLTVAQPEGINVRMIQAVAAQVGCSVRFVNAPWARALKLLEQGDLDVISQLTYNEERAKYIAFIGPHLEERVWLIADPSKVPPLHQLSDLIRWPATVSIAVLNGAYFGEAFQQLRHAPSMQRRFYPMVSNQDKLALLESGRVQAVLEEELAWKWRTQNTLTAFKPLLLVHSDPVYFGFSRISVSPELLSKLVAAWQQLYVSGKLQQIRRHYLLLPQEGSIDVSPPSESSMLSEMPVPQPHLSQK